MDIRLGVGQEAEERTVRRGRRPVKKRVKELELRRRAAVVGERERDEDGKRRWSGGFESV